MTRRIEVETRWADRTEGPMPEVAEVLGVPTDQIIGVLQPNREIYAVLYTLEPSPEPIPEDPKEWSAVYRVGLVRDRDGILHVEIPPEEVPGFWADFDGRMKEAGF